MEVANDKRRNSRTQATPTKESARRLSGETSFQTELCERVEDLQNNVRKNTAQVFIRTITSHLGDATSDGSYRLSPGQKIEDAAAKLALQVEHAVFLNHSNRPGDPSHAYRTQLRSMMFNLKQNPSLRKRLITGILTPHDFSTMTTEEMASEELQRRNS